MTKAERRYVCRLIDLAVDRCEQGNLREQLQVPRWVAELVVRLQAAVGEEPEIPRNTIEARRWLLDARQQYMSSALPVESLESDQEQRACHSCSFSAQ